MGTSSGGNTFSFNQQPSGFVLLNAPLGRQYHGVRLCISVMPVNHNVIPRLEHHISDRILIPQENRMLF